MLMIVDLAVAGGKGENKMTLVDKFDNFMKAFVFRTPGEVEQTVDKPEDFGTSSKKWNIDKELTPKRRREIALVAPFFMKAAKKKNLDRFSSWFEFENINTRKPPSVVDSKIFQLFEARSNVRFKFVLANICVDIYGDGFLLKKYANDKKHTHGADKGKVDFELPPQKGAKLRNLELLNPEHLKEMRYLPDTKKGKRFKGKGVQHFY